MGGPNCGPLGSGGNGGNASCDNPCGVVTINQGQDTTLVISLTSQLTGYPFDLTGASEVEADFQNADGTSLNLKLTTTGIAIVNAPGGVFSATMTAAQTNLLQAASGNGFASFIVKVTIGGKILVVNFFNALQIVPPPFTVTP